jgi:hypothetical protein
VGGNVRRIESTGYCYGTQRKIVIIAAPMQNQIMSWEEF